MSTAPEPDPGTHITSPGAARVRRALLSVSDKRGIVEFAQGLAALGVEIVSTGGTARELTAAGLAVRPVEDFTGFPEMMDGRVKTLHPRLYAGLLARRDDIDHLWAAQQHDIEMVDLVAVNLYPFERTVAAREVSEDEAIENIDIGGPTMIRAAAKNADFVAVVVSPDRYPAVLEELRDSDGRLSPDTRRRLAAEAFATTARYDVAIARWHAERDAGWPPLHLAAYEKARDLPYGENPHQRAAYYSRVGARMHLLSRVEQLGGKELSYNNLLDLDSARRLNGEFKVPACTIVKHNNPCGCAVGETALEAYERAFASDPVSAFGGVIVVNRHVDRPLAERLMEQFVEVLLATGFDGAALEVLRGKANLRLLENRERRAPELSEPDVKSVAGGVLVQDLDIVSEDRGDMQVVTERRPNEHEWSEMLFAWKVCRHVRSNAIVLAKDLRTAGIGAGQMSRVDSVRLAIEKSTADSLRGAALASDAFFPFADGPQAAIDAGVTAIIQPGGSVRDREVIAGAEAAGVTMVFTGRRHFRH